MGAVVVVGGGGNGSGGVMLDNNVRLVLGFGWTVQWIHEGLFKDLQPCPVPPSSLHLLLQTAGDRISILTFLVFALNNLLPSYRSVVKPGYSSN